MTRAEAIHAWSPSLSPEGDRVAYVSDREGTPRVWVETLETLDVPGGRGRGAAARGAAAPLGAPLEVCPHQAQSVHWSVDGAWLAILVAPGGSPRTQVWVVRPDGTDLHEVPGSPDGATFLGPWTHQAGVLATSRTTADPAEGVAQLEDVATRHVAVVARGGQPLVLDLDRAAEVALVRRGPRGRRTVWAIDRTTGDEQLLVPSDGPGSTDLGRLSPDRRVAYVRSDVGRDLHAFFAVRLAAPGKPQSAIVLAERADADLDHIALTADGLEALLLWNVAGTTLCERMDLVTLERTELPLPEPVAHDCSFSRDGRWLAMTLEGPTAPRAAWLHDRESGQWSRLTPQRPGWTAPGARPSLERLRAHDGLELTGWLYRPASSASPGPAVVHFHGGPESQERPGYSPLFQALVARGIAVFAPNVRGSSGYGHAFVNADNREKRWDAIADVATCVRHLVASGVAAPGRIACAGRSYGGYLTLAALVFHPELFAAGVDICGMADFHTFYANTEPWIALAAYPKYGHPVHDAALLRALSPIHHFDALPSSSSTARTTRTSRSRRQSRSSPRPGPGASRSNTCCSRARATRSPSRATGRGSSKRPWRGSRRALVSTRR
jgi:dipeptidyl aminopeptidase/acylaminoacyl peptidase